MNPRSRARGGPKEEGLTQTPTYRSPPKRVSVGGEVRVGILLGQVDQEGGEDEHQEPNVPGGDQLLWVQQPETTGGRRGRGMRKWGSCAHLGEVGGSQRPMKGVGEGGKKYPNPGRDCSVVRALSAQ